MNIHLYQIYCSFYICNSRYLIKIHHTLLAKRIVCSVVQRLINKSRIILRYFFQILFVAIGSR